MLTVKKLADLLGLSPEVIRHYTHMGILKPVVNSGNNYKYYDEQDLLYLANIRVNRSLGLSLPQAQDFQSGSVQEISLSVPQKIGHSTTGASSNTSPGHIFRICPNC